MNIAFLTISKNEVVDAEIIDLANNKIDYQKITNGIQGSTIVFNKGDFIPNGNYHVVDIEGNSIAKVVSVLNAVNTEELDINTVMQHYDILDIIEDDYFTGMVVY